MKNNIKDLKNLIFRRPQDLMALVEAVIHRKVDRITNVSISFDDTVGEVIFITAIVEDEVVIIRIRSTVLERNDSLCTN